MGTCDLIPGVSGGTIAFITGIYDRLIDALDHINHHFLRLLFKGHIRSARQYIDGGFLIRLFAGIGIALVTVSQLMQYLLETYPVGVWGFFFGLILASSCLLILKEQQSAPLRVKDRGFLLAGIAIGRWITSLPVMAGEMTLTRFFFGGMIAIMAMILPGISGSYILLIMGSYLHVLDALTTTISSFRNAFVLRDLSLLRQPGLLFIVIFFLGAVIGLLGFSKLLHRIKRRFHTILVMVMTGFMIGALPKIRPRQNVLTTYIDSHGELQPAQTIMTLPPPFAEAWLGRVMMLGGFVLVISLELFARRFSAH